MFIIMLGDVISGVMPVGPFNSFEEAEEILMSGDVPGVVAEVISLEELISHEQHNGGDEKVDPYECGGDCSSCDCEGKNKKD